MDFGEDMLWKEVFFKDYFSVDLCLSKYTQKSDLRTLRKELKDYGNDLHYSMSEILKTETEAIVNLAENLTNLKSKIDDLSLPFLQLSEEIRTLYDTINGAQETFKNHLDNVKASNTKCNHLIVKLGLISTSHFVDKMLQYNTDNTNEDLILLERAVSKYSFQIAYLQELGLTSNDVDTNLGDVEKKLTNLVNNKFLQAIDENDLDIITRCLRMYVNLNQQIVAEKTYRENVIRPALEKIFTQKNLEKHEQKLDGVYQEGVNVLTNKMSNLLAIEKKYQDLRGFNFVLNSFWLEVDKQIRDNLPNITAPGNPEFFQKRFKSTWNFLKEITNRCDNPHLLQQHHTFQEHIRRFNLAVYFEIRFQQIAGKFESNINDSLNETDCVNYFKLKITDTLWECLVKCFHHDVFLDHIADQMLRLAMLLLSRYLKWFESHLQKNDTELSSVETQKTFLINALIDFLDLKIKICYKCNDNQNVIDNTIFSIVPMDMRHTVVEFMKLNNIIIDKTYKNVEEFVINLIVDESITHLQQVGSIPRLYRRTNRNIPKEQSNYVTEAVYPLLNFRNNYKIIIKDNIINMLDTMISKITTQYVILVNEVLNSVCKTEESLRRLKSRNLTSDESGQINVDIVSDEAKIREQIKLDVEFFIKTLLPYTRDSSTIQVLIDVTKTMI